MLNAFADIMYWLMLIPVLMVATAAIAGLIIGIVVTRRFRG